MKGPGTGFCVYREKRQQLRTALIASVLYQPWSRRIKLFSHQSFEAAMQAKPDGKARYSLYQAAR